MSHKRKFKLSVPQNLYEKIGGTEKATKLIKLGLLSLRVTSLEKEIADLIEKTEDTKKRVIDLPYETERLKELLREAIKDREELENLLNANR